MKITDALLAEHVVFHHLFDRLEVMAGQVNTLAGLQSLAALLEQMLQQHSEVEDRLLMEPLEHCLDQLGMQKTFHEEHEAIDRSLEQIKTTKTVPRARRLLMEGIQRSREHFDKEERLVFPIAEESLSIRTLNALGQEWREQRKVPLGKLQPA